MVGTFDVTSAKPVSRKKREDGEIIHNRKVGMEPAGLAVASELNARYGGIRFYDRRISFKEMIFISPSRFFILP